MSENGVELQETAKHGDAEAGNGDEPESDGVPLLNGEAAEERRRTIRSQLADRAKRLRKLLCVLWKLLTGLLALVVVVSTSWSILIAHTLKRETGLLYLSLPIAAHLFLDTLVLFVLLHGREVQPAPKPRNQVEFQRLLRANKLKEMRPWVSRGAAAGVATLYCALDLIMSIWLAKAFLDVRWLFTVEGDGRVVPESRHLHLKLTAAATLAAVAAALRVAALAAAVAYLRLRREHGKLARRLKEAPGHKGMAPAMEAAASVWGTAALVMALTALALTTHNAALHLGNGSFEDDPARYEDCDPLDTTLCALPFPSSYFLQPDETTATGWRVHFGEKSLPFTRKRRHVAPRALNALDGFSTLAPLLFYLPGMTSAGLAGPNEIALSVADNASTVLIEASTKRRVPHFCEVDALDPTQPLAILQPAEPLRHGERYVVGVWEVTGEWGELLPPTPGFQELINVAQAPREAKILPALRARAAHFKAEVFPLLAEVPAAPAAAAEGGNGNAAAAAAASGGEGKAAAPGAGWQLAWDFTTTSARSQLGLLEAMRDDASARFEFALAKHAGKEYYVAPSPRALASPSGVDSAAYGQLAEEAAAAERLEKGPKGEMYRILRVETHATGNIARTVLVVVNVPSYVGAGSRAAGLEALPPGFDGNGNWATADGISGGGGGGGGQQKSGSGGSGSKTKHSAVWAEVSFTLQVPRSVADGARPAAVVQFGHGLFGDRFEATDSYLGRLAQESRWLVVSTDWRGMSRFDLPTVARVLVAEPELFEAVVANLMQSFVNFDAVLRLVAAEHEALASVDGVGSGAGGSQQGTRKRQRREAAADRNSRNSRNSSDVVGAAAAGGAEPVLAFYGISQGGILGAGYTAFSRRLSRSVLGSAGTPFALLLSRSIDFGKYDALLRLNMRGGRDARVLLSLMQMLWDRVEAAGWRAAAAPNGASLASSRAGGKGASERDSEEAMSTAVAPVLLQAGTGDAKVSTVGTEILARSLKAMAVPPLHRAAFGIPVATMRKAAADEGGAEACGGGAYLAWYEYVAEEASVPETNLPPPNNGVHECVRRDADAQAQVMGFIASGCVQSYCDGPCTRAACGYP